MAKINIAEMLRDCPKGMELDCVVYDNLTFDYINEEQGRIYCKVEGRDTVWFTIYGCVNHSKSSKCVIFPKGKTTWEGFQRPFKDGDVVFTTESINKYSWISIFKRNNRNKMETYADLCIDSNGCYYGHPSNVLGDYKDITTKRLATEEEKQKLFDAIKANGYKWNAETRTLDELPKFRKGDWVIDKQGLVHQIKNVVENVTNHTFGYDIVGGGYFNDNSDVRLWTIQDAKDGDMLFHSDSASNGVFIFKEISQRGTMQKVICYCDYDSEDGFCLGENHTCCWTDSKILHPATKEQCDLLFSKMKGAGYKWNAETKTLEKLVVPKFKVGDRIKNKNSGICDKVIKIFEDCYLVESCFDEQATIGFDIQDNWELAPNKFDINTLVPFESKVLVRDYETDKWSPAIWGFYDSCLYFPYIVVGGNEFKMCIPYEGNQELMGTTKDCEEFYKTWEE